MKITMQCNDTGATVALRNVKLNGVGLFPRSNFIVDDSNSPKEWTVKGFDFAKGFVMTGEIKITGNFSPTNFDGSFISMALGYKINNNAPICVDGIANPDTLWPPNHDFLPIQIQGVFDPDQDSVSLRITRMLQDEPMNAQGDGNFVPDGFGIGTHTPWVRSERSGGEDGRVYHIYFTGDDGFGGKCTGEVKVGVPKSQGAKGGPVDSGPNYNSTFESLSFSPKFLRFLYQEKATTSIPQYITMTNITTNDIIISPFSVLDPFDIMENNCEGTLSPGDSCTFAVTFTPPAEGIFKGLIRITSSATDTPQTLRLWGMGGYLLLRYFDQRR